MSTSGLRLELDEELAEEDVGAWEDQSSRSRNTTSRSARETDCVHIDRWNECILKLLSHIPQLVTVICPGNHDGLLCCDRECPSCGDLPKVKGFGAPGRKRWPIASDGPARPSQAVLDRLLRGVPQNRVWVLVDEWVDLTFEGQPLRVRACDLMPLVQQQVSD